MNKSELQALEKLIEQESLSIQQLQSVIDLARSLLEQYKTLSNSEKVQYNLCRELDNLAFDDGPFARDDVAEQCYDLNVQMFEITLLAALVFQEACIAEGTSSYEEEILSEIYMQYADFIYKLSSEKAAPLYECAIDSYCKIIEQDQHDYDTFYNIRHVLASYAQIVGKTDPQLIMLRYEQAMNALQSAIISSPKGYNNRHFQAKILKYQAQLCTDPIQAEAFHHKAVVTLQSYIKENGYTNNPSDDQKLHYARSLIEHANILRKLSKKFEAIARYKEAAEIYKLSITQNKYTGDKDYRRLMDCYQALGELLNPIQKLDMYKELLNFLLQLFSSPFDTAKRPLSVLTNCIKKLKSLYSLYIGYGHHLGSQFYHMLAPMIEKPSALSFENLYTAVWGLCIAEHESKGSCTLFIKEAKHLMSTLTVIQIPQNPFSQFIQTDDIKTRWQECIDAMAQALDPTPPAAPTLLAANMRFDFGDHPHAEPDSKRQATDLNGFSV